MMSTEHGCSHCHGEGHEHEAHCGHEHRHSHTERVCACGHDHSHEHPEGHTCSCGEHHHHHDHHTHDHADDGGCACGCGHDHGHEDPAQARKELAVILIGAVLWLAGLLLPELPATALHLAAFLLVAWDILKGALRNIRRGDIFGESFLMTIAGIGAVCIGEIPEGIMVFLLYRLGEYLQIKAVSSSRRSISALLDVRPDRANLLEGGEIREVHAEDVEVGAYIVVRPGEKIPLDGTVVRGSSALDTAALTGESVPREVASGHSVMAGCINLSGALEIRVERSFGESTASKILEMVEHAGEKKAVSEKFITRFARKYTPAVVAAAVAVAVLPPVFGWLAWGDSLYSALCFLAISCPCALVISVPLSFFAGIGRASREGVLVKGGNHLEVLAGAEIVGFDKTGTLTVGRFQVSRIIPAPGTEASELLFLAASAESLSSHPIARSICDACEEPVVRPSRHFEHSGHGVHAAVGSREVLVGSAVFLRDRGVAVTYSGTETDTAVFAAADGRYLGAILLRDTPKKDSAEAIARLKKLGVRKCVMLSGDSTAVVNEIGSELGVDYCAGQLLPGDKLSELKRLRGQLSEKGRLLYAGDGINDTPVLASADLGIAMGGLGTDAAIETADVIIMGDEPSKIPSGISIARFTVRIAWENIVFSIAAKLLVMALALLGHVELWAAVLADVGVCLLCVLNTLRITRYRSDK